jgi:hypothetical protein
VLQTAFLAGGAVVGPGGARAGCGGGQDDPAPALPRQVVCGVSRVLPDSMLRRRQYGVEVIWAALLAAVRGGPWNWVAAQLGVP